MLSQVTLQQYGSTEQMSVAQVLHVDFSFEPVAQTLCLQVPPPPPPPLLEVLPELLPLLLPLLLLLPPPPQLSPQIEPTSPTHTESHLVLQQ